MNCHYCQSIVFSIDPNLRSYPSSTNMLVQTEILQEYLATCKILKWCLGSSCVYKNENSTLKFSRSTYIFSFLLCLLASVFLGYHAISILFSDNHIYLLINGILVAIFLFITHLSWTVINIKYENLLGEFFTSLITFERKYFQGREAFEVKKIVKIKASRVMLKLFREWGVKCFPSLATGIAVLMPQTPINILICVPKYAIIGKWIENRVIIALVNAPFWYFTVKQGMMVTFKIFIGALSLGLALQLFLR